jgi:tetratricopeptide (TPR) repeat protein
MLEGRNVPGWRMAGPLAAMALALSAPAPAPAAGSLAESWYLVHGRSSMRIGNFRAAVEAFQKAVEIDPDNREAARSLGLALERDGQTDRAIAQFDRYLARFPDDAEIAFKQARYLGWQRYAYRRDDAVRYYRLGLARIEDPVRRRELARLLARDRRSLDEAVQEYRRLVAASPDEPLLGAEYRKLLVWDPRYRDEAIREFSRRVAGSPGDLDAAHGLAQLLARDPSRAKEAAEQYQRLLEKRPGDTALRREYARLLAKDPARRAEAREQYRQLLAADRGRETRAEFAELLAADRPTRGEAIKEFSSLVRESPTDARLRVGYARLLEEHKETSPEAVAQYQRVLERHPGSAAAHAGLARAYAWNGDPDRALSHGDAALRGSPGDGGTAELIRRLRLGREPWIGAGDRWVIQSGGAFGLTVQGFSLRGSSDVTPFATSSVEAGLEGAWSGASTASGPFFSIHAQVRPRPTQRADAQVGWEGLRQGGQGLALLLQHQAGGEELWLRPRFERRARHDSFLAFVGPDTLGRVVGAASDNLFGLGIGGRIGTFDLEVVPQAGWVSDAAGGANMLTVAEARLDRAFELGGGWTLRAGWDASVSHYGADHSGFLPSAVEPLEGGYFSPRFFLAQGPRAVVVQQLPGERRLALSGGPALQWQWTAAGAAFHLGGDVRAELDQRLGRWRLGARAALARVSDVYTRIDLEAVLALVF